MDLEYYEVEGRGVGRVSYRDRGYAWVWDRGAWRLAPGLVGKTKADGYWLSRGAFEEMFPEADLDAFDELVASVPEMHRD